MDFETALARMDGDSEIYLAVLDEFLGNQRDDGEKLKACYAAGDLESAIRIAHNAQSIFECIGLSDLAEAGGSLERRLHEGRDPAAMGAWVDEFNRSHNAIIASLDRVVAQLRGREA